MPLAESDRGWMAGVASAGIVTITDPRLAAGALAVADPAEVVDLIGR
jgi:hypothetical protein